MSTAKVLVVGAGLAGSEASWFLAGKNIEVILVESKRLVKNPAQKLNTFGELVCTNSLKSKKNVSAHGLLKYEMQALGSLVLRAAYQSEVPAGDALAVDRVKFSQLITQELESHPLITIVDQEVDSPAKLMQEYGCDYCILATGPLTSKKLENWLIENICDDDFYFYDAIAPVVEIDSLDTSKMFFKDRHKDGEGDYLNVPLNKAEYEAFVDDLIHAEKVPPAKFEEMKFFESCLPIDIMAQRGVDTLRFSCMKPIGLELDNEMAYAVIQLRKENLQGSSYNMVGFQNRLTYGEQKRVLRKLPGFKDAVFNHLGSVHRNSFLNAKKLLDHDMSSLKFPQIFFAGQIVGVEGYTESASMGLYVAYQIWSKIQGKSFSPWPKECAIGALVHYVKTVPNPTPSNINFGLLPAPSFVKRRRMKRSEIKNLKKSIAVENAKKEFDEFFQGRPE